ncbi:DUF443 domain-containing protein, partial [Staphylococcus epidermidis]|uniref:DUF443 domain-containing protein n=1 Tax=Staphylococcus epidermidis TaxID=1282 RepID=UPI0021B30947
MTLPLSIRNKLNHPPFNKNTKQTVIFIPSFKNIIILLFPYFIILFLSIPPLQIIFHQKQNILLYISSIAILFLFTI